MKTLMDQSRVAWHNKNGQTGCSNEDIQTGAPQRIADATEKMATNYTQLQNERDKYKRWYEEQVRESEHLKKRISSLQGVITKLKNKTK